MRCARNRIESLVPAGPYREMTAAGLLSDTTGKLPRRRSTWRSITSPASPAVTCPTLAASESRPQRSFRAGASIWHPKLFQRSESVTSASRRRIPAAFLEETRWMGPGLWARIRIPRNMSQIKIEALGMSRYKPPRTMSTSRTRLARHRKFHRWSVILCRGFDFRSDMAALTFSR
jgi:hypothetical protein